MRYMRELKFGAVRPRGSYREDHARRTDGATARLSCDPVGFLRERMLECELKNERMFERELKSERMCERGLELDRVRLAYLDFPVGDPPGQGRVAAASLAASPVGASCTGFSPGTTYLRYEGNNLYTPRATSSAALAIDRFGVQGCRARQSFPRKRRRDAQF